MDSIELNKIIIEANDNVLNDYIYYNFFLTEISLLKESFLYDYLIDALSPLTCLLSKYIMN